MNAKNKINKDYRKDAYHEAGHAILADYFGLNWQEISIERSEDGTKDGHILADDFENKEENCLKCAAYLMAGLESAILFSGCDAGDAFAGASEDFKKLNEFCNQFPRENEEELVEVDDTWVMKGQIEAARILRLDNNKQKVEKLVEILIEKKTITRAEYDAVCKEMEKKDEC